MLLYRISKTKYARDLSSDGARKAGGRWNLKGIPVIYTSDSTALATLEALIHTPLNLVPKKMSITSFELPDNLEIDAIAQTKLPRNWAKYPAPVELAEMGTKWAEKCGKVVLRVPSSVTPYGEGNNYILNPRHRDFQKIKIISIIPYKFDTRLHKK